MINQIMKKLIEASSLIIIFIPLPPFQSHRYNSNPHAKEVAAIIITQPIEIIKKFK